MRIETVTIDRAETAAGTVVVVDVLRAFTTAAHAFSAGAREIVLVAGIDEARELGRRLPGALTMGEEGGRPLPGFDLHNSPTGLEGHQLTGRVLVMRTSAGTQGVVRARGADGLVAASFVCASATARWVTARSPQLVTFVITGAHSGRDGDEDRACADYLAALLGGERPDPEPYLRRVPASEAAQDFGRDDRPWLPQADVDAAVQLDRFDLAMPVEHDGDRLVMRPVVP
ncbi:MAG TPA: 2-phosphosulfolactate phosphatase [Nitriliruptorales bacterium]|nr:2-phosphosulfolactate phosphatase [Nitriliruptorales bacterium]